MENTLLRTAQNEGHVCPRRGKGDTPRVLEVVESSSLEF